MLQNTDSLNLEELELLYKVELLEDKILKETTSNLEEQVRVTDVCPLPVFSSLMFVKASYFQLGNAKQDLNVC